MGFDFMDALSFRRWANILSALLMTGIIGFLSAALSEWVGQLSEIEYPANEFGKAVTYPEGFWLYGTELGLAVTAGGALLAFFVRNAVITVEGFDKPRGSMRLQVCGFVITGFGVAFSSLNPGLGPLVFISGLACLVISFQQKVN